MYKLGLLYCNIVTTPYYILECEPWKSYKLIRLVLLTRITAIAPNYCIGVVAELIGLPWAPCWAGWPWARSACRGTRRRCTWWRDTLCATATSWSTTGSGRCRPNRPPGAPGEQYRRSRDIASCAGSKTRVHKICPQTIKPFNHESHFFNSCSSDRLVKQCDALYTDIVSSTLDSEWNSKLF